MRNEATAMAGLGFEEGDAPMSKDDVDKAIALLESTAGDKVAKDY